MKMRVAAAPILACSLVPALLAARVWAATASWESIGPTGINIRYYATETFSGRVSSVAAFENGDVLIATAGGGIWKYSKRNTSWSSSSALPVLTFGAVAIAPSDEKVAYAGSGEAHGCSDCYAARGFFKSTDGGARWVQTLSSQDVVENGPVNFTSAIVVDPRDANHIWVAGDTGLWETTFAGDKATWTQRLACTPGNLEAEPCITSLALDPVNPDSIYVGDDGGIWRFVTDLERQVRKTRIDLSNVGLPEASGSYYVMLAAGAKPQERFYAAIARRSINKKGCLLAILRSDDGSRWSKVDALHDDYASGALPDYFWNTYAYQNLPPLVNGQASIGCTAGQAWYDNAIAVNPDNVEDVAVAGINVLRSHDGGAHWQDLTTKFGLHPDAHSLTFSGGSLYIANDGGLDRFDGDVNTPLSSGLSIMQFYQGAESFGQGHSIIAGTQDNGTNMLSTTDRGASPAPAWSNVLGGDGGATAVDPDQSGRMYAENPFGVLSVSDDGGAHWKHIARFENGDNIVLWWRHAAWIMPFRLSPTNETRPPIARRLYVGAEDVYRSSDGGVTWSAVTSLKPSASTNIVTMDVRKWNDGTKDLDVVVAGWSDGSALASYDGGDNWSNLTAAIGSPISDVRIDPTHPKRVYVVLNPQAGGEYLQRGGTVLEIADASHDGATGDAVDITGNLHCTPYVIRIFEGKVYLGCDDGVYTLESSEAKPTWTRLGVGLPAVVVEDLLEVGGDIVAVTHGRGLWRMPIK